MNKLSKLKEQYAKLGEEIEALENEFEALENEFEPGWYACWYNKTSNSIYYFIDFIPTNESLSLSLSTWDNVVKIDKDAFDKLLNPKTTIYDWSKIPKEYNWAVINENGDVHTCGCIDKPIINEYATGWRVLSNFTHGWKNFNKSIIINPVDDWTKSCEHRPEQE